MADKTLNVTIEGAEDLFQTLEEQLQRIASVLDDVTKKMDAQTKATKKLGTEEKKGGKTGKKFGSVMGEIGSQMAASKLGITGAAGALAKLTPYTAVAAKGAGMLAGLVKQLYEIFLGYNRRLLETGDVMGHLDLRTGNVTQAMNKLLDASIDVRTAMWNGNMSVKEFLATLKGFTAAGLMATDLKERLGGLEEATKIVTTYSKLFTMDTTEMATSVGMFVREMNLSAESTKDAFSEIFNASVDARYGTANFLRTVTIAVPAIANFGGSIKEVSRFLKMMGSTGVISMRQAQETIGAVLNGMKTMNMEQRLYASALVNTDDMLKIMKNRYSTLQKQIQAAQGDTRALTRLNYEAEELRRDIAAATQGDRLAMARAMKRYGAAEVMEITFKQAEKIMGKQLTTLEQLSNLSARDEMLLTDILRDQGINQNTLEVMRRLMNEGLEYDGEMVKTPEQFIKALRESDKFRKSVEQEFQSDQEKANELRQAFENKIANTLEIIKDIMIQQVKPAMDKVIKWIDSLDIGGTLKKAKFGLGTIKDWLTGGQKGVAMGMLNRFMPGGVGFGGQGKAYGGPRGKKKVPASIAVPRGLLEAGQQAAAYQKAWQEWSSKKDIHGRFWQQSGSSRKERKELIEKKQAELAAQYPMHRTFTKSLLEIFKKAKAEGKTVTMSSEIKALIDAMKASSRGYITQDVKIIIQGGDPQKTQKAVEKALVVSKRQNEKAP